jgi:hypothetical protein
MVFFARTMPPSHVLAAAQQFDDKLLNCAMAKLQISAIDSQKALQSLKLPLRGCGFGLRPITSVLDIAFIGGVIQAAPWIQQASPFVRNHVWPAVMALRARIHHAPDDIRDLIPATDDPVAVLSGMHRIVKFQNKLTRYFENAQFAELLAGYRAQAAAGACDAARLSVSRLPRCSAWLTAPPVSADCTFTDTEFQLAALHRMGVAPAQAECKCELSYPYPAHVYVCQAGQAVGRPNYTHRHNMACEVFARYGREAGAYVYVEPPFMSFINNKRPDLEFNIGGRIYLIDMSIMQSTAASYRDQIIRVMDAAVKQAEQRKHRRYDAMAAEMGATVVPVIIDSMGGMGKEGLAFIQLLTAHAADPVNKRGWTVNAFTDRITWAIQGAVHKGNARIVYKRRAQEGARRRAEGAGRGGGDDGGA